MQFIHAEGGDKSIQCTIITLEINQDVNSIMYSVKDSEWVGREGVV